MSELGQLECEKAWMKPFLCLKKLLNFLRLNWNYPHKIFISYCNGDEEMDFNTKNSFPHKTLFLFVLQGIGRRYANIVLKKADIPLHKRAGELSEEDTEKIITIMQV